MYDYRGKHIRMRLQLIETIAIVFTILITYVVWNFIEERKEKRKKRK